MARIGELAEGTKVLGFKDEDEINGMPLGEVFLATINGAGYPAGEPRPFDPNREPDPWFTLAEAQALAKEKGLPLVEV